jgi:hypothetical protein
MEESKQEMKDMDTEYKLDDIIDVVEYFKRRHFDRMDLDTIERKLKEISE